MAPRFPDDQQGDETSRRSGGVPEDRRSSSRQDGDPRRSQEPVDFGAFVSRSVRSSADRLRQSSEDADSAQQRTARTPATTGDGPEPQPRKRSPRYWRDSLREGDAPVPRMDARDSSREESDSREAVVGGGGGRGDVPVWGSFFRGGDGEGPDRRMLAYLLIGIVILLLLIFGLVRIFGGDNGEDDEQATETPVPTEVVVPGGDPPGTPDAVDPTQPGPDDSEPTATSEVRRGGDNQLGGDDDDEEGTPEARGPAPPGEVAGQCTERCLVRVESDNIANSLEETGNRPSFSGDDIAWVVATPDQVAFIEQDAEVEFVRDSADTLSLYMLTVPQGGDPSLAEDYGQVIDAADVYRLVDFNDVPARVTTLVDNGFLIHKVMPASPVEPVQHNDRPAIGDASAGSLMGQVSDANIRETISTLQQTNASGGSSLGSRYYTLPGNQVAADYLFRQLESYGLDVWYEDFLTPEGILLVNVVAEAPGDDDSAVYAVMAHLDSINGSDPRIAPGADDNASGMAVTLEMARILAQYQLQHPVRFVFVNAEEVGILGATAWARQANANGVQVDGVYNVDSVGSSRQGRLMVLNSDASSQWLQDVLVETNQAYGLGQEILSRQNPIIVADDNMVRAEGIDAVMVARELYGWTDIHHTADDVIDNVSVDNVLTTTYLVLLSVVQLAR